MATQSAILPKKNLLKIETARRRKHLLKDATGRRYMGCDIHMWAEEKQPDGTWTMIPNPLRTCLECGGRGFSIEGDQCWRCERQGHAAPGLIQEEWYEGRNYSLFGRLAGVRGDAEPLAEPRGIPGDACLEYREEATDWGVDGHSHSWLTIEELLPLAFEPEYQHFIEQIKPLIHRAQDIGLDRVRLCFFFDN